MRQTGIQIIGDVPWGTHFCQFYKDQQDLIDILVPYFKAGLENNEFCMWITSEPLGMEEAKAALAKEVEGLEPYIRNGQIEILDYSQWYTTGGKFESDRVLRGWVEKFEAARERGFAGLRLSGNTFWLEKSDWQDFTDYEAAVDGVIGQYRMLAICTYSLAKCGAAEIMDVVSNHAFALIKRAGQWQVIESAERKRLETSLRDSEERLRLALDSTGLGTWDFDPQTGDLVWSDICKAHFGVPPDTTVTYDTFLRGLHPEDRERVDRIVRGVLQPESGGHYAVEYRTVGIEDGKERWISSWGRAFFDSRHRALRFVGVTLDITDRKRAEERFQRLYEANIVGIICADSENVFEANDLFLNMIGYTREDLEAGRLRWRELTPPEYLPVDDRAIEELLTTGSWKPFEKEYVRKDGSRVAILIGATLLERSPLRWLCFILDLTERKQLERRILEAQKLESVGLLAGGIAHDFNNLLVGVIGNASLAQESLPPGHNASELLDGIIKTGEQLAHLTRQMLAYSGKGRFVVEPLDLSDLIPEMSGLVQPSIPKKIALHLELERDLPPVEADRGQMQQVYMNLVLNAAEAIGSNAGLVSVKTGLQTVDERYIRRNAEASELRPGKYVYLEVGDTGCGMDEATKAKIFDPFFSTKFTGRGLGLAAVAGIVRGHKGAIKVNSAPGKGTCFTVLFPAADRANAVSPFGARHEALRGTGTVLVVDDEEVVRKMAKKTLEHFGYKVLLADSGLAAIDTCKRHPGDISLVVLDLSMPEMGGEEALPELRKIRPNVKIVVSSGYSETETMTLFRGQRVSGFVQKPYTSIRLAEKISYALR